MLTTADFEHARTAACRSLDELILKLESLRYPDNVSHLSFNLKDVKGLDKSSTSTLLKGIPSGTTDGADYVYVIHAGAEASESVRLLAERFAISREVCKGFSKLNLPIHSSSHTLYVGRSKKLRERLRQHLGAINPGRKNPTYALWLGTWCEDHDLEVTISYIRFVGVDHMLVQAVEDGLWSSLQPVFGRRGDK